MIDINLNSKWTPLSLRGTRVWDTIHRHLIIQVNLRTQWLTVILESNIMKNPYPNTIKASSSSTFTWWTSRRTYRIATTKDITRTIPCKVIWTQWPTLVRVTSQLSTLTTRHTISSTSSNCNSKHVSNSTRTCSKPRAWPKCRTS